MAKTKKVTSYTVVYERDEDGWWVAEIPTVPGCHTQGRTIASARRRIREALAAYLDDERIAKAALLTDDIRLPESLTSKVSVALGSRDAADKAAVDARQKARAAIDTLTRAGLSLRDAGELLKLSHQRIGAILHAR